MKSARLNLNLVILFAIIAGALWIGSSAQVTGQADPATGFLGRWDLTLKSADHEYPSWIEIGKKDGAFTALFTGRWGNARPLPRVAINGTQITFVSPKEEEGSNADLTFQGSLDGDRLSGAVNGPDGTQWTWTGARAPKLDRRGSPKWGEPIQLFNGRDLSGWHPSQAGSANWTVKEGNLVSPGHGPELINDRNFEDFKLHLEFNCGKESNSGVYLRGRYEVQIETDSVAEPPSHHTGGVYGFLAPTPELPRRADAWQTLDITLIGRRATVIENGQTIIENREIPGLTGGALDSHEGEPGPLYLQGSEKGHVLFRKIAITPAQ